MSGKIIYLDNSATTKISEEALQKYVDISRELYGNPSSLHALGYNAEKIIDEARNIILSSVGAKDSKIIFTSSGSEANNLAIFGRAFAKERFKSGKKIITTMGEHASVAQPFSALEKLGYKIAYIPTLNGELDNEFLKRELTRDVILVSIMMVNNETGALYDTAAVKNLIRTNSPEALLHVDATQSYMKLRFTKRDIGADLITLSSHKIEGPKGVGALVIDSNLLKTGAIAPMILGGGQEGGFRSGTENVPGIAAFGEAARLASLKIDDCAKTTTDLRKYLIERLGEEGLSEIKPILPKSHAPHILNITLPGIKSETMLHYLSSLGIYVSSGSACSSNSGHTSSALLAYGLDSNHADTSIRISFSSRNTKEDVDALCEGLKSGISKLARKR